MKKRTFIKLLGLLPLSSLQSKTQALKHEGIYAKGQDLYFKTIDPFSHLEINLISGEIEVSHTNLRNGESLIIPANEVSLRTTKKSSFVIREV